MKFGRAGVVWMTTIILSISLLGCGAESESAKGQNDNPTSGVAASGGTSGQVSTSTRVIQDAKGEVKIPLHPQRIADISGSTEELLILGHKPILTGNTDMGDPKQVTPILQEKLGTDVQIGGWFQTPVNIEAIAAADPDLILAGPTQSELYEELQKIAPTVRVPYGFNAFRERFAFVSKALDKEQAMSDWLKQYDNRVEQLRSQIKNVTKEATFAVIEPTAKEIRIYSSTGVAELLFEDLLLPKAPGTPDPDGWGGKVTSLEGLSTLNPDHIVLMSDNEHNVLEDSKLWTGLKAVKSGYVYRLTTRQNYNEAFTALGKQAVLEQVAGQILHRAQP
ncbi:ABC transporter substrate-binding protein [Paenibacillus sp. ACRRX]|uniref:ABC transporter substrate-binding protein n=1 Tax=Paenibacillus sp. ACRRX TaxID=2918206 RepID=UPI001EF48E03|nr:ABC transporter substrate-binding protein [Paenibacillus sp. ACRRX]MCG7409182.1 ABC transporter substrate-binding protein [Paenibacillus sp. ACRRX]